MDDRAPIQVFERATAENFSEHGYVLANPDVAEWARKGGRATRHFRRFGQQEGRRQVTAAFLDYRRRYLSLKHPLFEAALPAGCINPRYALEPHSNPVVLSDGHFARAEYVAESANAAYGPFVEEILANPGGRYLDLGCGLRPEVMLNCLYVEVYPSLTADVVVAPRCPYPLASESFDGIGCFAVLEHVAEPWRVAAEIHRMLRPGGRCFIDWPFLQPVHGYPSHYFNATRAGLEAAFRDGFDIEHCRTEKSQTPDYAIAWLLGKFIAALPPDAQKRIEAMSIGELLAQPPSGAFWEALLEQVDDATINEFACGNTLIARKKTAPSPRAEAPSQQAP